MVVPLTHVGQVVGGLQHHVVGIRIAHRALAGNLFRTEAIGLQIVIVDTVAGREGQSFANVELQIDTCIHDVLNRFTALFSQTAHRILLCQRTILVACVGHAILLEDVDDGSIVHGTRYDIILLGTKAAIATGVVRGIDIGCHMQPVGYLSRHVGTCLITVVVILNDDTLFTHKVSGNQVLRLVVTTGEGDFIILCDTGLEDLILPVCRRSRTGEGTRTIDIV